jgi:hypothetical protein
MLNNLQTESILGYDKYKELHRTAMYEPPDNSWFIQSYEVFVSKRSIRTKQEFIELIAFAYSWMPTIPDIKPITEAKWKMIKRYLSRLNRLNKTELQHFLRLLVPIINNSIVGTSKVLHFLSPKKIPIIDSRVLKAWNKHFGKHKNLRLGTSLLAGDRPDKVINTYLQYRGYLLEWQKNCKKQVSIRDLEKVLYSQDI